MQVRHHAIKENHTFKRSGYCINRRCVDPAKSPQCGARDGSGSAKPLNSVWSSAHPYESIQRSQKGQAGPIDSAQLVTRVNDAEPSGFDLNRGLIFIQIS